MWIPLPEEAKTKVFCVPQADRKLIIYIFWQKQANLSVIACDSFEVDIDMFALANPIATIGDLIKDVLFKDASYRVIIGQNHSEETKTNVFRFKNALDDPSLLFWRPFSIHEGEWPFIFFLKMNAGRIETSV